MTDHFNSVETAKQLAQVPFNNFDGCRELLVIQIQERRRHTLQLIHVWSWFDGRCKFLPFELLVEREHLKWRVSDSTLRYATPVLQHPLIRQAIDSLRNIRKSFGSMDDAVAHFSYDLTALRLEYKTTCDALTHWRGGDPAEQQFLMGKKQEVFRALAEASFGSQFRR